MSDLNDSLVRVLSRTQRELESEYRREASLSLEAARKRREAELSQANERILRHRMEAMEQRLKESERALSRSEVLREDALNTSRELKAELGASRQIMSKSRHSQDETRLELRSVAEATQSLVEENNQLRAQLRTKTEELYETRHQLDQDLQQLRSQDASIYQRDDANLRLMQDVNERGSRLAQAQAEVLSCSCTASYT